jgi:hypothetical protein
LNDLRVDTFATTAAGPGAHGTVRGRGSIFTIQPCPQTVDEYLREDLRIHLRPAEATPDTICGCTEEKRPDAETQRCRESRGFSLRLYVSA